MRSGARLSGLVGLPRRLTDRLGIWQALLSSVIIASHPIHEMNCPDGTVSDSQSY